MRAGNRRHVVRRLRLTGVAVTSLPRDIANRARYGNRFPRVSQRVWIDPRACVRALREGVELSESGRVREGDWDRKTMPVEDVAHIRVCLRHWRDGVAWEDTGAYEDVLATIRAVGGDHAGLTTREDVVRRYERLDKVFARVRDEGRLKTRSELDEPSWRERGGIYVHIGRDGSPIFNGWGGCHRLAMASVLGLGCIPAQLGMVHPHALWALGELAGARPST